MAFLPGWSDFNSYLKGNTDESALFPTAPILKAGTGPTGAQTFGGPTGPAGAQTFGAAGAAPSSPPPAATAAPSTPTAPTAPGPSSVGQGAGIDRYFQPIAQGVQKSQKSLDDVYNAFSGQAGPARREFGDSERNDLQKAYLAPDEDRTQKAKALLGAEYKGPQGLDQGQVAGIRQGADELKDQARALRTTGGLQTTIQDTTPGLTAGSSRFEARHLLKDPSVKERSRSAEEGVNQFYGGLVTGQEKAKEFAAARTAQEADVAAQSRGLLEGARAGITGEVDTRVAAEADQQAKAQKAFDDLVAAAQGGDYEAMQGAIAGADQYSDEDLTRLDSPEAKLAREGQARYSEIMADAKYDAIKDMPLLTRSITARGKEYFSVVGPDGKQVDIRDAKNLPQKTQKLLIDRQRAVEKDFRQYGGKKEKKQGAYADVMGLNLQGEKAPLDEGGDPTKGGVLTPPDPEDNKFVSEDIRSYVSFDPGLSPSRQNVSTEQERKQINAIGDLLGMVERLDASGDTMRAAKLAVDIDKYLVTEAANVQARADAGDKEAQRWGKQVARARKQYKKAKEAGQWAIVANVIISVAVPVLGVYYGISQGAVAGTGGDAYGGGSTDPIGRLGGQLVTGTTTDSLEEKGVGPPPPGIKKK